MKLLYHGCTLFLWVLLQPSKWHKHVFDIHSQLEANFSLISLNIKHWRNIELQRTLFAAYLLLPFVILVFTLPLVLLVTGTVTGSLKSFLFVYMMGLCVGIYVSFPASILFIVFAGIAGIIQWAGTDIIIYDYAASLFTSVLLAGCSACMIIAAINHGDERAGQSVFHQIGAIILGLIISFPLIFAVIYLVFTLTIGRQSGAIHGGWIIWTMLLPPLIFSTIATYLKTRLLLSAVLPGAFCFIFFSLGFGELGYEYDRSFGGFELFAAIMTVIISTYCICSFLSIVLVQKLVGDLPAHISGAVGGLAVHFGIYASFTYYPLIKNLLISLILILTAVFFKHVWSFITYPFQVTWNRIITEWDKRQEKPYQGLHFHSACWDEIQHLPFFELKDYLLEVSEYSTDKGAHYIDVISRSKQRQAAQLAVTELDARQLETLPDVNSIADYPANESAGLLPTNAGLIQRSFTRLRADISAALAQPSNFNQILVLRTVSKDLEQLSLELNRDHSNTIAQRYARVANHWHKLVLERTELLDNKAKASKEIPNPYTVGAPLTRRQQIFVGRTNIARILEDILKLQDHPPLLLYGARRMGKTSLLYQLNWMLPSHILTLIVDLQGPPGLAQDAQGFFFALARAMRTAAAKADVGISGLSREQLMEDPFVNFDEWLNTIEAEIAEQNCDTIFIALDEFEALDTALSTGRLQDHEILGTLRHIIQHRRNIKIMLVGSHTLGEFQRWSSYFVNAQVIELGYLGHDECVKLIEHPMLDFPLRYEPEATRRIIQLTNGHPYLLQLVCAELIARKNTQEDTAKLTATAYDIDKCLGPILERGQQFFTDIERNQTDEPGRLCLRALASFAFEGATLIELNNRIEETAAEQSRDELTEIKLNEVLKQLTRRRIISESEERYSFEVEAVKHWFS